MSEEVEVLFSVPEEIRNHYLELKAMDHSVKYAIDSLETQLRNLLSKYEKGGDLDVFHMRYRYLIRDLHRVTEFSNEKTKLVKNFVKMFHRLLVSKLKKIQSQKRSCQFPTGCSSQSRQPTSIREQKNKDLQSDGEKHKRVRTSNHSIKGRRPIRVLAVTVANRKPAKHVISAAGSQSTFATEQIQKAPETSKVKDASVGKSIRIRNAAQTDSRSDEQDPITKKRKIKSSTSIVVKPKVPKLKAQNPANVPKLQAQNPAKVPKLKAQNPAKVPKLKVQNPAKVPKLKAQNPVIVPKLNAQNPAKVPKLKVQNPAKVPKLKAQNPVIVPKLNAQNPAKVPKLMAQNPAKVPKLKAQNPAKVPKLNAQNPAKVPKLKAQNPAIVPKLNAQNPAKVPKLMAQNPAKVPKLKAQNPAPLFETPPPSQEERDEESKKETNENSNEPKYCVCYDVFYGKMIACDGRDCPIEWFHYSCVGITKAPRGKWYCSGCRTLKK